MSKKTDKTRDKAEEKELDEVSSADEGDEDEGHTEPAVSARTGRARVRAARTDDHHGHDDHDGEAESDDDDPYWWTPHVVMSALVLVGVLGFFGMFNKALGGLAIKFGSSQTLLPPAAQEHDTKAAAHETKPSTPTAPRPAAPAAAQQRELFGAKHLLVMYKGGRRAPPGIERSKDEAKVRAEEAAKKAKGGTKFEELVTEYSDEPGAATRGGDLGKFPKGSMVPEFQAAVEKLKVGEVSGTVESPFGYHVILRTQ